MGACCCRYAHCRADACHDVIAAYTAPRVIVDFPRLPLRSFVEVQLPPFGSAGDVVAILTIAALLVFFGFAAGHWMFPALV